jgi:hypothetical protein
MQLVNQGISTQESPVTREMLQRLEKGEMKMSELTKDQVRWIATNPNLVEEGDDPNQPHEEEQISKSEKQFWEKQKARDERQEAKAAKPQPQPQQVAPQSKEDLGARFKQKADEANHLQNVLKNKERAEAEHKEKLKTDPIYRQKWMEQELGLSVAPQQPSYKPSTPEEYLTDEHLGKVDLLRQEIEELKLREAKKAEAEIAHFKRLQEEEKFSNEMRQIETLQAEIPSLKTSKPFRELNSEFIAWKQSLGADNVNKYLADPAFKKQCDAQGYTAPAELDKVIKILTVHHKYSSEGYPSLRSAFRDSRYFDETISTRHQPSAAQQSSDAVRKKLEQIQQEPKIMNHMAAQDPMNQTGMGPGGMTEDQMYQFELSIKKQARPMTAEQKAIHQSIMGYLQSQGSKG